MKSNGEAVDIIDNEGIAYATADYCDGSEFRDPTTRLLWTTAGNAIENLRRHLRDETGREVQ